MSSENETNRPEWLLIRTKLNRPQLPEELVARPRLVERLEKGLDGRVTLIAAPAGYGKTTLALQWLAQRTGDTAWVSLSHRESEPERFASYLVTAIHNQRPGALAQTGALLEAQTAPPWSYFSEVLLSELAVLEEPLLLALDDYHVIASREVHELVVRMVEELPETVCVVALGRIDPPWPLGRWRGKGWLSELRGRDLRFSPDEIRAYFTGQDGPSLEDAEIDALGAQTEGWAAGLQLARISVAQAPNPHERARRFSGDDQLVVDYLMSEVLALQPPEVRQLFAVTAPLERFSAPLCAHLFAECRPECDAGELLARLERHQLFLVPLDAEHRWFRYHHLFRQLLLQRLPELDSSEQRAHITARAAEWFAGEDLVEEAIRLWLDSGAVDAASDLLGHHLHRVIGEDLSRRLLKRWLELFPPGEKGDRLPLLVADLYLRVVRWDFAGIAELLERAEEVRKGGLPQDRQAGTDLFSADLDAVSAFACFWQGDPSAALRHAERALETIGDDGGGMAQSLAGLYRIGAMPRLGRHEEAFRLLDAETRRELSRGSGRLGVLLFTRAILQLYENDLDGVAATTRRWLAADESTPPYWAANAPYLLGVVALEQDRPEEAEKHFQNVKVFRHLTNSRLFTDSLIGLALVAERRSDREAMVSRVEDARRFALEANDPTSLEVVQSLESRLARFEGSPTTVPTAATNGLDPMSFWLEVPSITRAENMLLHPDPEAHRNALAFVDELLARAKMIHNHRQEIRLMVLRSDALEAVGRTDEAREALDFALQLARPHRIVRPFLGGGPRRTALLESLAARSRRSGFLKQLLRAVATQPSYGDELAPATGTGAGTKIGPPLTRRELETLELLARRLTNKEIAARLSVTSAAVKKRLESVYAKLDVHTRREAVAAAVARGFIRTPSF
ncbi:MAG: LuxR C-terminal-related transcriptional regulator [Acidobacteriota bacterium]|nr:LuxR C-terminal-related transcriptional regulator [Acidobacteriota bacterium]